VVRSVESLNLHRSRQSKLLIHISLLYHCYLYINYNFHLKPQVRLSGLEVWFALWAVTDLICFKKLKCARPRVQFPAEPSLFFFLFFFSILVDGMDDTDLCFFFISLWEGGWLQLGGSYCRACPLTVCEEIRGSFVMETNGIILSIYAIGRVQEFLLFSFFQNMVGMIGRY